MSQPPPKIPLDYSSLFSSSSPTSPAAHPTIPSLWTSWAEEFFDFSESKLAGDRRTISHSAATLEPLAAANSTIPPTPSEHNSGVNGDNKLNFDSPSSYGQPNWLVHPDQSEAETSGNLDLSAGTSDINASQLAVVDPKRVKRILANRQSARRSRVRKLQYISELEKSVATLQTEVLALSPRVALLDRQRSILVAGNSHLKQCIAALAQDKIFKDAHQASLKKEIERLNLVYHQQQKLKKMAAMTTTIDAGGDDTAAIVVQNELRPNP